MSRIAWQVVTVPGERVGSFWKGAHAVKCAEATGIGTKITTNWLGKRTVLYEVPVYRDDPNAAVEAVRRRLACVEKQIKDSGAIYKPRSYLRSRKWVPREMEHDFG